MTSIINNSSLTNFFNLTPIQSSQISQCTAFYSRGVSFSTIIERITDLILSLFGKSKWQVAQKVLEDEIPLFLPNRFRIIARTQETVLNASDKVNSPLYTKAISEFILKYMTTASSQINSETPSKVNYLIPKFIWEECSENEWGLQEIIDQILTLNGQFSPDLAILHSLYKHEFKKYKALYDTFSNGWHDYCLGLPLDNFPESFQSQMSDLRLSIGEKLNVINTFLQEDENANDDSLSILDLTNKISEFKKEREKFRSFAEGLLKHISSYIS